MFGNDSVMAEFINNLKNNPHKAYVFFSSNSYRFDENELKDIIKELLFSLHYHVNTRSYGDLYGVILDDTAAELEEIYNNDCTEENQMQILTPYKMVGRYADDEEIIVGGNDEEDCMYKLIAKQEKHGKLTWYSGVTDENYSAGEIKTEGNDTWQ